MRPGSEDDVVQLDAPAAPSPADPGPLPLRAAPIAPWILGISAALVLAAGLQRFSGQREHGYLLLASCLVLCSVAAFLDVATRRIPNKVTYPAILLGLTLNTVGPRILERCGADTALVWLGAPGDGLLGFGLCALIGVVSFVARGLGGGDVKLLAAVGALLGFHAVVPVLFNTLVVAAVLGLANWALRGTLVARIQVVANNLLLALVTKRGLRTVYSFKPTEGPFGLSLLVGLVLAQFVALHRVLLSVGW